MKILYVIPYFIPAWKFGGPLRTTYEVAKKLISKGHKITVLTTDVFEQANRVKYERDSIDGIEIIYLKNWSDYLAHKFKIFQPRKIRQWLKNNIKDFDVIHIQDFYSIMTFWVYRYALREEKSYLISMFGVLSDLPQKNKLFLKKVFNLFLKKIIENASKIIAQTEVEKEEIERFGFDNIAIINNGIDLDKFNILPKRELFREKYYIENDKIIILFLGRINKIKGLKYLVEAIAEIHAIPLKLVIVGPDDNYRSTLLKLINRSQYHDKIIHIDGLYNQEKLETFASADVYVLPSLYDCAPNSMLEACACGLPIITTYNNGLYKIVQKGAGIVVNSKSSKEIREAILFLIKHPEIRKKMGAFGRDIIFSEFDWTSIANSLEKLYLKIL